MLLGSTEKGHNSLKDILNSIASDSKGDLGLHKVSEKVGLEDITSTLLLP
jgi:hypothetical protein